MNKSILIPFYKALEEAYKNYNNGGFGSDPLTTTSLKYAVVGEEDIAKNGNVKIEKII